MQSIPFTRWLPLLLLFVDDYDDDDDDHMHAADMAATDKVQQSPSTSNIITISLVLCIH